MLREAGAQNHDYFGMGETVNRERYREIKITGLWGFVRHPVERVYFSVCIDKMDGSGCDWRRLENFLLRLKGRTGRTDKEIQSVLDGHKDGFYEPYDRSLSKNPEFSGTFVFKLKLLPPG